MRFCPYAQRIHLVLDAKSIAYHTVNINLKAKPDWLQSHSVTGKVPALRLTNEPGAPYLVESLIVADYLEEKFPTGLYAAGDPVQKANDRLRLIEFEQKVIPAYFQIAYSEANEVARQQLRTGLRVFDDELRKRATPFYGGRNAGMLDLMMWPWAERVTALAGILDDSDFCVDAESFPEFVSVVVCYCFFELKTYLIEFYR